MTERRSFDRVDTPAYWVSRAEEFEAAAAQPNGTALGQACRQIAVLVIGQQ
jgi:hypothetical protein